MAAAMKSKHSLEEQQWIDSLAGRDLIDFRNYIFSPASSNLTLAGSTMSGSMLLICGIFYATKELEEEEDKWCHRSGVGCIHRFPLASKLNLPSLLYLRRTLHQNRAEIHGAPGCLFEYTYLDRGGHEVLEILSVSEGENSGHDSNLELLRRSSRSCSVLRTDMTGMRTYRHALQRRIRVGRILYVFTLSLRLLNSDVNLQSGVVTMFACVALDNPTARSTVGCEVVNHLGISAGHARQRRAPPGNRKVQSTYPSVFVFFGERKMTWPAEHSVIVREDLRKRSVRFKHFPIRKVSTELFDLDSSSPRVQLTQLGQWCIKQMHFKVKYTRVPKNNREFSRKARQSGGGI
ncbi:hypothetical protein B0H10DRAFT_2194568 [Mycena sp. CBHHK59/15]|nr:hypothetical protein B0H10DRAFT_2194568 [Mycena sp. CBHHK59/15]